MAAHDDMVLVARLGRAHGVRGEIRAWLFSEDSEALFEADVVHLSENEQGPRVPYPLRAARVAQRNVLLTFEKVRDRDAAEALNNHLVWIHKADLPQLHDPDEFYHHDLIGRTVVDPAENILGKVEEVWDTPGGAILIIRDRAQNREVLIPFNREMVEVTQDGPVRVDPPEGLIEATTTPIT